MKPLLRLSACTLVAWTLLQLCPKAWKGGAAGGAVAFCDVRVGDCTSSGRGRAPSLRTQAAGNRLADFFQPLSQSPAEFIASCHRTLGAAVLAAAVAIAGLAFSPAPVAAEGAAALASKSKMKQGGASTGDRGSKKNMTRGVVLDKADFSKQDLTGVSFQQSIVRNAKFVETKLQGASFFDANLEGTDFTGANMNQANIELARFQGAILTNAVMTEMYMNGTTRMEPADIVGADFTDTPMRKDQQAFLCKIASGTNPTTQVATRESLMCPE